MSKKLSPEELSKLIKDRDFILFEYQYASYDPVISMGAKTTPIIYPDNHEADRYVTHFWYGGSESESVKPDAIFAVLDTTKQAPYICFRGYHGHFTIVDETNCINDEFPQYDPFPPIHRVLRDGWDVSDR